MSLDHISLDHISLDHISLDHISLDQISSVDLLGVVSLVDDTIKELPPRHKLEHNVHFELLVEDLM
jgi:hypothetical protein